MWFETLPAHTRARCEVAGRIARAEALDLLAGARVMLAPTLSDGIPNSLLEAMAYGALPIVTPLATLEGLVEDGRHVLMARNLYPEEIADALVRAMHDDRLVDRAADENLELVTRIGDRDSIGARVATYYREQVRLRPGEP
jgi:glycosyltransferase involved in cell wall biosynthesis